ncbi:MAG: TatD family hydrolase [Erysipelotrichaceae bacterium]|nr:TatD family hydrolase [Erysipelotrichaceae bacterium]
MMNWLDSHCHINDSSFREDLDEVLKRMEENDVLKAMIISSYIEDYDFAKTIVHPKIAFKRSLGIYPGDVDDVDEVLFERFAALFEEKKCNAIGEIGLDYHWTSDNKEKQKAIFKQQIELAEKLGKPLIVHSRDAIEDTYEILKDASVKGVMHCYGDDEKWAMRFVELGFYISIAGPVTWKKAKKELAVIHTVPLDRLLIETDCPYLAPSPMRGKRNEPSFVVYTGKKIAEELGVEEEEFKRQLNENYHSLFTL